VPLTHRMPVPVWNVSLNAPFDLVMTLSAKTMAPAGLVTWSVTWYPAVAPVRVPVTAPF